MTNFIVLILVIIIILCVIVFSNRRICTTCGKWYSNVEVDDEWYCDECWRDAYIRKQADRINRNKNEL